MDSKVARANHNSDPVLDRCILLQNKRYHASSEIMLDQAINFLLDQIAQEESSCITSPKHRKIGDSDDSSSNSSNSPIARPAKRKRTDYEMTVLNNISKDPNRIRLPRVLKSDLRKKFPIMFVNMMNMAHLPSIANFMIQFVAPSCDFHEQLVQPDNTIITPFSIHNISRITQFLYLLSLMSPDHIMKMKKSQIITRSDTFKTEIIIDYEFIAKRLFESNIIEVGFFVNSLSSPAGIEDILDMENMNYIPDLTEEFHEKFKLAEVPEELNVGGRMRLIINNHYESNKLDAIYFEAEQMTSNK